MSNYKAIVAKIDATYEIQGADKIQVAKVLGETVIVSKELEVGYVGLLFLPGTQLSEDFCKHNNLYRNKDKNIDPTKAGFFEDSRRVRAQPFMKVKSDGYFTSLESLSYIGDSYTTLKVGDSFEELSGVNVCKKYLNEKAVKAMKAQKNKPPKVKVAPYFREHVDTEQFKHNIHKINKGDLVSIQSKRHGTSQRVGYMKVLITLPKWKQLINKVVPIFPTEKYDYLVGTRRVLLDTPDKEGFHGSEGYRFEIANQLFPYLSKGMEIYLEVVGWANGKPIMSPHNIKDLKDKEYSKKYGDQIIYKYGALEGTCKFHIYRISLTTEDGSTLDYTQQQLVQWCKDRGFDPAFDVIEPFVYDGDKDKLIELVDKLTERPEVLTEDYHDPSMISEGVIIRVDRNTLTPLFLKSKSYAFKLMEGIISEKEVDMEDIS